MMTDEPLRVDAETPDLAAEKLAQLQELFPGAFADGVVDAARIGELVGMPVAGLKDGRERYGLMWAGKQEAVASLLKPSRGTLVPDMERSIDFENARNVFIEGDNLEVLKILQKSYNDRVNAIFIDPPYNSGTDFVYEDDFADSLAAYLELTGQVDSDGRRLSATSDTTGRRHSRWLSMMYPRLVLARNLLHQNGVLFLTIDDREHANLKLILDEIFGEENFVASMVWQSRTSISDDLEVSPNHNYVLIYARNHQQLAFWGEPLRETEYSNPDDDPRGPWKLVPLDANKPGGDTLYEVTNPNTGVGHWPPSGRSWAINRASMAELIADNRVKFGLKGDSAPKRKLFLRERVERGDSRTPSSLLLDAGTTKDGTEEIADMFGAKGVFDYPKPTSLVRRLLRYATAGAKDAIVMDFFAGSGTTGHAVMQLNAEDGGTRRFILVQWPEDVPEKAPARALGMTRLTDITLQRLLHAATELHPDGFGVRVECLAASAFSQHTGNDLVALVERTLVREEASAVAQEVFLREGVRMDRPWATGQLGGAERIASGGVTVVTDLELTQDAIDAAIESNPRVLVFLEDAFAGKDALKASAFYACKQAGVTMKTV